MKQKEYVINGKSFVVEILSFDGSNAQVRVNGADYSVQTPAASQPVGVGSPAPLPPPPQAPVTTAPAPSAPAAPPAAAPTPPPSTAPASGGSAGSIVSPMPGTILKILVEQGHAVQAGEPLLILEAMKMENEIPAPRDGTVKQIHVSKGGEVQTGSPLIDLE